MKCKFCGKKIDGKLVLVIPEIEPSHLKVCSRCFNLYVNGEYSKLKKIINDYYGDNN